MEKKKDTNASNSHARAAEKKSGDFTRKIEPLHGGLVREMVHCGRTNCKCVNGSLHGPYHYRVWMVRGRRFKKYVKKADFDRIKTSIEAFRTKRCERQQFKEEIKTILRENREAHRRLYAILRFRGFKI